MRRLFVLTAALALVMSLGVSVTLAASPAQQKAECDAAGGTYDGPQGDGEATCTIVDPVGNSPEGGPQQTIDKTDGGKGNLDNQGQPIEECSGPGNTGSDWKGCN
jgi:hypothetical protein